MLCGRKENIDVWRLTPATGIGNWGDPEWSYHHTFLGVIQPFEGSDATRNNQRFANVRHMISCPTDTDVYVDDQLVFRNDYSRIVYIQEWDSGVISHLEIYTADTQEDKTGD